jgi:hypothetical protein
MNGHYLAEEPLCSYQPRKRPEVSFASGKSDIFLPQSGQKKKNLPD